MKNEIDIDSLLTDIELANQKAGFIIDDLNQGYFGDAEPNKCLLKYYYKCACIKSKIVEDYIAEVSKKLIELRNLTLGE